MCWRAESRSPGAGRGGPGAGAAGRLRDARPRGGLVRRVSIWEDTARKSPGAWRPHFQLAFAYYKAQRYDLALQEFEKTARLHPSDPDLLLDWGLAYDSLNQFQPALEKLQQSAALRPTAHVYSQIGEVYGKQENWPERWRRWPKQRRSTRTFPTPMSTSAWCIRRRTNSGRPSRISAALWNSTPQHAGAQYLKAVVNQMRAGSPNK
jgi:tetratricopeptide (TPR) repeat protein